MIYLYQTMRGDKMKHIIESFKVFFGTFFEEPEGYEEDYEVGMNKLGWVLFGLASFTILSPFIIYFFIR